MAHYDAELEIAVTLTYHVLLQVEADTPAEARDKLTWRGLGLTRQELDRLTDGHPTNRYDGQETTVTDVGEIEEVPDDEAEDALTPEQRDAAEAQLGGDD